jgi:DNA-binding XRE family transcriptional regulator
MQPQLSATVYVPRSRSEYAGPTNDQEHARCMSHRAMPDIAHVARCARFLPSRASKRSRRRFRHPRSGHAAQPRQLERACRCGQQAAPTCALHTWRLLPERNYTCAPVHPPFHKDIPALPFTRLQLSAIKPTRYPFRTNPKTLGDQLRNRRLALGLRQGDVAESLGVTRDTIRNWEADRVPPAKRYSDKIRRFLN